MSKSPITTEIIRTACYQLSQKHPLLRMYIPKSDHPLRFHPLDNIGIKVQQSPERNWLSALNQDLSSPFKYGKNPLWRVTLLPDAELNLTNAEYKYQCVVIIGIDHAIADGLAFFFIVGQLMTYICSIMENDDISGEVQSQPLPENMEVSQDLYKGQSFARSLLYYAAKKIPSLCQPLIKIVGPKPSQYSHTSVVNFLKDEEQYVKNEPVHMKIVYRCMNEEETSKLLKKSKANGVSPAAALLASYFLAFQQFADISGKQVKFAASKSIRNLTKHSFDLVSAPAFLPHVVEVPDNSNRFWEFSDMCNFDRDGSTRLGEIHAHCYELVTEWLKTTKDTPEGRADTLVRIANFGRCKWLEMSAESPMRLEGVLSQAQADLLPNNPTFYISCLTVNNKMSWYMSYFSNKFRENTAVKIADTMFKILKEQTI